MNRRFTEEITKKYEKLLNCYKSRKQNEDQMTLFSTYVKWQKIKKSGNTSDGPRSCRSAGSLLLFIGI